MFKLITMIGIGATLVAMAGPSGGVWPEKDQQ